MNITCKISTVFRAIQAAVFKGDVVFKYTVLPLLISSTFSIPALSNECKVQGNTLRGAKALYAQQCAAPRGDCDKVKGVWHCTSEKNYTPNNDSLGSTTLQELLHLNSDTSIPASNLFETSPLQREADNTQCVDSDGDGWGWNGVASCIISDTITSPGISLSGQFSNSPAIVNTTAPMIADCIDSDGDGWGWDGIASCRINHVTEISTHSPVTDTASHITDSSSFLHSTSSIQTGSSAIPENCQKISSGNYHITELVTDVFLTAGQSNAAGNNTRYEPRRFAKDRVNNRVIVWTENNQWEIADPNTQTWHDGKFPGGYRTFNHPAFQIGRAIADLDECRVVAFISTAAMGMPIDHWRHNVERHYTDLSNKVTTAINALPAKHEIDMIWWMQGEADNDEIVSRYYYKLTDLISKFRSESWFSYDGYFLANETGWFPYANEAIRLLRSDNDIHTDYSLGEDSVFNSFPSLPTEIDRRTHFNEISLRKIGDLVAGKYVNEYLNSRQK